MYEKHRHIIIGTQRVRNVFTDTVVRILKYRLHVKETSFWKFR
jgi:hypothetical protein